MLLLLPSLLCSAYSDLAIDDLPTIFCTISSELIQIFSAASSHNAHLLLYVLMPSSLLYLLSMTSILYLLNIFQQSPSLALMATQEPTCIWSLLLDSFLALWHQCQRRNMLPLSCCSTYSPCQLWASWKYTKYSISTPPDLVNILDTRNYNPQLLTKISKRGCC